MTRSLKLYNGSDSLPIIDLTETDGSSNADGLYVDWDRCEFGATADHGQSTTGKIVVIDPNGRVPDYVGTGHFLSSHNVMVLTDGPTTVWRGRIEAQDVSRGETVPQHHDRYREWVLTVSDYNADLQGIVVHNWARPAETDKARVQALIAAYLSGSPRATTNLNGSNYVSSSNTVSLPAETYTGKMVADVLSEIATTANKQFYVDTDGNFHYDGNDSVAFASALKVSDIPADWDTVTYPPETPTTSEEGREEITALRYYYGNNTVQQSIQVTDPTHMVQTDYWEGMYWDSDSITSAQAATRANALMAVQRLDVIGLKFSLGPISGGQTGLIRAGQMINVKSRALVGGRTSGGTYNADSYQLKRIAELRWRPVLGDPLNYLADLSLERPIFLKGRPTGSQAITTTPTPPVPPTTTGGATLLEHWTWDGGSSTPDPTWMLHAANSYDGLDHNLGGNLGVPDHIYHSSPGSMYTQITGTQGSTGMGFIKASPGDYITVDGWFQPYADTCKMGVNWYSSLAPDTIISSEYAAGTYGPGVWSHASGTFGPAPAGTIAVEVGGLFKSTDGNVKTGNTDDVYVYRSTSASSVVTTGTAQPTYGSEGTFGTSQTYIPADSVLPLPQATGKILTNKSGASVDANDVVVQDSSNPTAFTTTTTLDTTAGWVGVATETIANGSEGMVQLSGYAPVRVPTASGSINLHDYLYTSTSAKVAHGSNTRFAGAFGQALQAGSNVVAAILWGQSDATSLAIAAGTYIEAKNFGNEVLSTVATSGSSQTINGANGNVFDITLTANCTFTFSGATASKGDSFTLILRQDGTGSRTATWPGSVAWPGGTTPTLQTAAAAVDVFSFFTVNGGTNWFGFPTGGSSGFSDPMTTIGDIIVRNASNVTARLAIGGSNTYLKSIGSGAAPLWDVAALPPNTAAFRELVMQDGVTSPPEPLETEDGTDWIYADTVSN